MKSRWHLLRMLLSISGWTLLLAEQCPSTECLYPICRSHQMGSSGGVLLFLLFGDTAGTLTCPRFGRDTVQQWAIRRAESSSEFDVLTTAPIEQLMVNNLTVSDEGFYNCRVDGNDKFAGCIFVLMPAMFATCSVPLDIQSGGLRVVCEERSKPIVGVEGKSVTVDTRVIYYVNQSGPCCFPEFPSQVFLEKVETRERLFFCNIRMITLDTITDPISCMNSMTRAMQNYVPNSDPNNILDFTLTIPNLSFNDSGEYSYTIHFQNPIQGSQTRTLVKNFSLNVTEAPPTTFTTSTLPGTTPSTNTGSTNVANTISRVDPVAIVVPVIVTLAILVVSIVVVVIVMLVMKRRSALIFKQQGKISLKEANSDNEFLQPDGLLVNNINNSLHRPVLDSKGRPISYVESFPGTLSDIRDSATANI